MKLATVQLEPILISAREAAALLGIGRRTFYRLHSSGRVPLPVRLGGVVRWRLEELQRWTQAGCPSRGKWAEDNSRNGA